MRISDWSSDVCSSDLQAEILKDDADTAAESGQAVARHRAQILAEQAHDAAARPLREIEHPKQRGLARARCAGQEIKAARLKVEADVAQHLAVGTVAQPDIVELDHRAAGARGPRVRHDVSRGRAGAAGPQQDRKSTR